MYVLIWWREDEKMALIKGKKRLSIDLDQEVYEKLEKYLKQFKKKNGDSLTKGQVINECINVFTSADDVVAEEIMAFCSQQQKKHMDITANITAKGEFQNEKERRRMEVYESMMKIFARTEPANSIKDMKKIALKDGYVVVPEDWIIVNGKNSEDCKYAYVLETSDSKLDEQVPHFLYFSNSEDGLSEVESLQLKDFARTKCKLFAIAESHLVDPIYSAKDEYGNRKLLNLDDFIHGAMIGVFKIKDAGISGATYPFNAQVFRK